MYIVLNKNPSSLSNAEFVYDENPYWKTFWKDDEIVVASHSLREKTMKDNPYFSVIILRLSGYDPYSPLKGNDVYD